jgi:hypothetical protein
VDNDIDRAAGTISSIEGWWCSSTLGAAGLEEDRSVDMNRELRDVSEFVEYGGEDDEVGINPRVKLFTS